MGHYLKIPGETPFPVFHPSKPRPAAKGMAFLVFVAVFCACGYAVVKYGPAMLGSSGRNDPAPPTAPATSNETAIPMAEVEDLLQHLQNADAKAFKASTELQRSEQWLARISSALQNEYLAGEKRRLDVATAALESARQSVEESREQLEITKNLLMQRSK
jgi:hypothetical protein